MTRSGTKFEQPEFRSLCPFNDGRIWSRVRRVGSRSLVVGSGRKFHKEGGHGRVQERTPMDLCGDRVTQEPSNMDSGSGWWHPCVRVNRYHSITSRSPPRPLRSWYPHSLYLCDPPSPSLYPLPSFMSLSPVSSQVRTKFGAPTGSLSPVPNDYRFVRRR